MQIDRQTDSFLSLYNRFLCAITEWLPMATPLFIIHLYNTLRECVQNFKQFSLMGHKLWTIKISILHYSIDHVLMEISKTLKSYKF